MEQPAIVTTAPPKNLDKIGRGKWREVLPILETRGDVTAAELDLLNCYCQAWASLLDATDDQDKVRWMRALRQLSSELRLTPRSRTAKPKDERDPLLRLLKPKTA
jgi:phage terminase small subunit